MQEVTHGLTCFSRKQTYARALPVECNRALRCHEFAWSKSDELALTIANASLASIPNLTNETSHLPQFAGAALACTSTGPLQKWVWAVMGKKGMSLFLATASFEARDSCAPVIMG